MQLSFKADNYQHFQREVSALAAHLNRKPHIVTVVIEDIDEVTRINPEAREDLDSLIAEMAGETHQENP